MREQGARAWSLLPRQRGGRAPQHGGDIALRLAAAAAPWRSCRPSPGRRTTAERGDRREQAGDDNDAGDIEPRRGCRRRRLAGRRLPEQRRCRRARSRRSATGWSPGSTAHDPALCRAVARRIEDQQLADEAGQRRHADHRDGRQEEQAAEQRPCAAAGAGAGTTGRAGRRSRRDQVRRAGTAPRSQRAVHGIVERGREASASEQADGDQQRAHGPDHREADQVAQARGLPARRACRRPA